MSAGSLDYLISSGQQRFRDGEAERLGGFEVDQQLELDRLDDREVGRFLSFENSAGIEADLVINLPPRGCVADQTTSRRELSVKGDRG
jgi:hypothetical protein